MSPFQTTTYRLHDDEGQRLESLGARVVVEATSEQTGGLFNLFVATCPAGYATPLHIHYAEDVAVYVLEGALSVFWGTEQQAAVAGTYCYQPRGIPHGFRVDGTTPARILYLTVPAGFDRFVVEQERLAPHSEMETAAAHYQIEVLGPLPE